MKKIYSIFTSTLLIACIAPLETNAHTLTLPNKQKTAAVVTTGNKPVSMTIAPSANDGSSTRPADGTSLWKVDSNSMPTNLKAFQENKGQFLNLMNDEKIAYGANCLGTQIMFTPKGVIYYVPERVKLDADEEEERDKNKDIKKQEEEEHESHYKTIYHKVSVEWENSNANPQIEAIDKTPYYFGSVDSKKPVGIDNIAGYKKLVYHDVYPGIDVEFTFHPIRGIKYAIKVKPGYDASVFKVKYKGQDGLTLDANGNLHIATVMGDILDHAPVTTQNGKPLASSFEMIGKNEVAFNLGAVDKSAEITIDPWVFSPVTAGHYPTDIGMDNNNNVYVLEWDAGACYEQKYTAAGALSWTYNMTQYGSQYSVSDMTIDPVTGNTYTTNPYYYPNGGGGSYAMLCLNSAGVLSYFYNTYASSNVFETWNVKWSCQLGKLAEAGSPTVTETQSGCVNPANGNFTGALYINTNISELYAGTIAPNGTYYCISANYCFCNNNTEQLVAMSVAGASPTFLWNAAIPLYNFSDFASKVPGGIPMNAIAASCSDIYTTDGLNIYEFTLAGAVVTHVAIPGGVNTTATCNAGIAVDPICGTVYVGTQTGVRVYTSALALITTYAAPGIVYDVTFNNGLVSVCGATAAGVGFVEQYTGQTCPLPVTMTETNATCGNNNGTATATPTFCAGPYSYLWAPTGKTTQTITGLSAGTYTVTIGVPSACFTVKDSVIVTTTAGFTLTSTTTANDKCNGGATGTGNVAAAGGTAPYTYNWAPGGQTTAAITGLTAGTYTVTVKDATGCSSTATITITQPPALTASTTVVPVKCNGGATGSSTVTAGGGTPGYLYSWAPGGNTNANATGLTAGTYTVTVTDANGCTITATSVITQPPALTATTIVVPVKCNGGATGTTSVTAGGGTPAYVYTWAPGGQTTSAITGLSAGTYTVTVKDANGCTITATSIITQPPVLTATTTVIPVKCNGGNGSSTVTAGGGTPAYNYAWAPGGQTSATVTNLTAGTYTVTVTDANGCTTTATSIITQPPALTASTTVIPVKCNGGATGSSTVTAGGGTPAYLYSWAPGGQTSATATNLTAGTYTVTVTDANGCTITATSVITQPTALTATTTVIPVKCNGGATGSSTVTAGGGTPAYLYSWAPGGQTNITATGLTAGTYTVTVTDANGCTKTATSVITQPPALTETTSSTTATCGQSNGSVTVTAGGGTPAYVYAWAPGGATTANVTGLSANTYTVTVTDANGCTITAIATVANAAAETVTITGSVNILCNGGATGSITTNTVGGTPPYNYAWTPSGGTGANATGLTAGCYTITVHDANGCVSTASACLTQPTALTAAMSNTPVKCNAGATGTATVTAGGGTPAYVYTWAPGGQTSTTATNLTAGTYTVTIKDANGCTLTASTTITQPTALTATTTVIPVKCNGGNTGSSTVTAGGGTPAYVYAWAPGGQTNATATNLTAGIYTITVTDANGCTITATATITQPTALTETTSNTTATCGQSNGSVTVVAGGGTPGYNYSWTPGGATTANVTGLSANTYTVTVTDANGCTITATSTIANAAAEVVSITGSVNILCNGGNNGSITTNTVGGTPPYNYAWTPSGQTGANATGLTAGCYTVTVHDANGCTSTASACLTQPTALTATTSNTPVLCNGGNTGSTDVTAGGGTPGYVYTWAPGGQTNANATNLTAGTYTVTVKDANGCTITATATVTQPTALTLTTGGIVNVLCNAGNNGSATATAGGGTPAYNYAWSNGQTGTNATGLTVGTYTVTATDANGCTITATATITQPTALTATTTTITSTCGKPNGSATDVAGGGTPGYVYSWAPGGQTNATATGLTAGIYTVTETDANGCTLTATATVANAAAETITITSSVNILCNGGNNGSINTNTVGGTPPYNYAWTPSGQTGANATGLTAGCYTVTVTDANGCLSTASACITEPTALTLTTGGIVNVLCNGGNNGSATATAGGGTPAYNYAWSNGQTGTNATGLTVGTYTVTVTDANGCTLTATATITQPTVLTISTGGIVNVLCNAGNNGSATTAAAGGTPAYNYSWSNGQTGTNATGLTVGTYTVTVTDADGCTATATATITQPTALTTTTTTVSSTCGNANGSATATPGGGTPGYAYSWTPSGQTTPTATGLSAGSYTVTVTDANGCTLTTSAVVNNIPGETVTINPPVNVLCNGGNNGSATTVVVGGTTPYTYNWTPTAQTTPTATGLTAGTYTVTVKDANGCLSSASVTITQPPLLTVTTGPATNDLCGGDANGSDLATAAGGTGAYLYTWTPSGQTNANATGLTAGTYTIQVTDANGCIATATTTITQPPVLTLAAAGFPVTCNGGSDGQATAIPGGGTPAYAYAWSNGATVANINNLTAGSYTVTITDAHGCTHDTVVTVSQPAPIVVAFSADTINGCAPLCTGFKDASTDPGGTITHWSWSYSDGGKDTLQNPRHCFTTPGTYTVTLTVTDNHGCTSTLTIPNMITVYTAPVAAFDFGPQPTTIVNPTINFTDKSTDAYGIASWLWNFNDPLNDVPSTVQNPSHAYGDTGTFCATLTVTNIHGCVDSITQCLIIGPEYSLYIPNAFSPNGDGKNETFMAKGEFVKDFKMYIFDRWGMLLYYTDDITKGWPGTVNGGSRICQEDTYVYLIEATDNQSNQHKYIGRVTLLK